MITNLFAMSSHRITIYAEFLDNLEKLCAEKEPLPVPFLCRRIKDLLIRLLDVSADPQERESSSTESADQQTPEHKDEETPEYQDEETSDYRDEQTPVNEDEESQDYQDEQTQERQDKNTVSFFSLQLVISV